MTDSTTTGGKRERLVAAACQTVYQQGIEKTTLADIAAAAVVFTYLGYAVLRAFEGQER